MKKRLTGFSASGRMRPLTKSTISAGTSVTERNAAAAIANVLVKARGRNSRPSTCSSVKTGRKETVTMSSEKNRLGPTSLAAAMTASRRRVASTAAEAGSPPLFPPPPSRSRCLCAFSTITRLASTITPMAMARPPRLMMLALMPSRYMMPSETSRPTGIVTSATKALRACSRKRSTTSITTSSSSQIWVVSVFTARPMRAERSYSVTTSTPSGSPGASSARRAFTRSMTRIAFSP